MDIHEQSPGSVLIKTVTFQTMYGRTYVAELYDREDRQHMVLTTEEPHSQSVFLRSIDSRGPGKWEDLCVFSSDIEDEAADVLAEAEDVMRFHETAHLAILECHPTNNTSYTIRRGKVDEEAGMLTEASGWAKQMSAYKDSDGKAYPASTIRILTYDANGTITADTLLQ